MEKTTNLTLRLKASERDKIRVYAKQHGLPVTKYIKSKALETGKTIDELYSFFEKNVVYILQAINKNNPNINKVLNLAFELLQDDSNKELFESDKDNKEDLPEHHLMDSLIKILVTKLSIIKSENEVAEDNSRDYAVKVLGELIKTFTELKAEVI